MKAQAPAASFAAAGQVLTRYSSVSLSAPFGGSAGAAKLGAAIGSMSVLDRYGRNFAIQSDTGIGAASSGLLMSSLLPTVDARPMNFDRDERLGLTSSAVGPWGSARPTRPAVVSFSPALGQTVMLGTNLAVGQASGLSGAPLRHIASLVTGSSVAWSGGAWSIGAASGQSRDGRIAQRTASFVAPLGLGLELSDIQERGQVLGASAGDGFDLGDARTTMATLTATRSIGELVLTGRGSIASTRVTGASDLLKFDGPLIGTAFALEGAHPLWGGRFTVGLSSTLRLERARAIVAAPVTYDLMTGALDTEDLLLNLAPDAREIDIELGWSAWLFDRAALRLGVAHAFDAGHVSGASDTAGVITFTIR